MTMVQAFHLVTWRIYFRALSCSQPESLRTWKWFGFIHLPPDRSSPRGEITAESNLGKGTTFHIYLPLNEIKQADMNSIPSMEETRP
jgi:hypothetical protein